MLTWFVRSAYEGMGAMRGSIVVITCLRQEEVSNLQLSSTSPSHSQ